MVCILCFVFFLIGTVYICIFEERLALTLELIECFISEVGYVIYGTYCVIQYNIKVNEKCALCYLFYYLAIRHVLISLPSSGPQFIMKITRR